MRPNYRLMACGMVAMTMVACDGSSDSATPTTQPASTTTPPSATTDVQSEDEYIRDAQIAVGPGINLIDANGGLTGEGASALETGYLACELTLADFESYFHQTWPCWRGPTDTPHGLHTAAHDHLCA